MRMLAGTLAALCAAVAAAGQTVAFEIVSIKPNHSQDFRDMRMQALPGGRFSATALPVRVLLVSACNLPFNFSERLAGVPDWVNRDQYDIEAKAPEGAFPPGLAANVARARMQSMLRALLADRFHLAIRRETKDMPYYALTVAKGRPKMRPAGIEEKDCPTDGATPASPVSPTPGPSACHQFFGGQGRGLHAKAVNMADLAGYIENWTDHPVEDKTGLSSLYAMDTEGWTSMREPPSPADNSVPNPSARPNGDGDMSDPARPTLFLSLRRLGLDLKPEKGPVAIYAVGHIERPTAN